MSRGVRTGDARFVGPVMGRYALDSRMRSSGVQIFACRLQSISTTQIVASGPVLGEVEEGITVNFEPFGTLRGQIRRHIDDGFSVDIDVRDDERGRLASKINWYKKRTFAGLSDKRKHRRFMPREARSTVVLASGEVLPCLIINMSASGVAVSADVDPPLGEPLAIGRAVGRVVRHLEVGFAVRFVEALEHETMEETLLAPEEWHRAILTQRHALFSELVAAADYVI
jgi:hypothetical protein